MSEGRLGEINERLGKLLSDLSEGLEESNQLKKRTDQNLDELDRAVLALEQELGAADAGPAPASRSRRRRVRA